MSSWGDFARLKAQEIFALSREALMAHSIRAVENYIVFEGRPYQIRLSQRSNYRLKIGSSAKAFIFESTARIVVDADLTLNEKRRHIGHELGHILIALVRDKDGDPLGRQTTNADIEGSCKIFSDTLCLAHHRFYKDPANLASLLFPELEPVEN